MRRSRWQRALAGLLGVWFTTTVTGLTLPACPEHGGGMLSIAQGTHQPATGAGMAHHAAHRTPSGGTGARAMSSSQSGTDKGYPETHRHHCTCPGMCCAPCTVVLTPAELVTVPVTQVNVVMVTAIDALAAAPRAPPNVVLPLPLGPPTLRV